MNQRSADRCRRIYGTYRESRSGFTLLELLLATLIASLVIGMLSVALSFSLGMWQREQGRRQDNAGNMIELIKHQLAGVDTTSITVQGQMGPLFQVGEGSLAFVTHHSVKALSKGAPAVVRYFFSASDGQLLYGEIPFDPYHPELIEEFLDMPPSLQLDPPLFYAVEMHDFSLTAEQEEDAGFPQGTGEADIPRTITLKWARTADAAPLTVLLRTDYLFPRVVPSRRIEGLGESF